MRRFSFRVPLLKAKPLASSADMRKPTARARVSSGAEYRTAAIHTLRQGAAKRGIQMADLPKFPPLPFRRSEVDRLIEQIERMYAELEREREHSQDLLRALGQKRENA